MSLSPSQQPIILAVDDSTVTQTLLKRLLKNHYQVRVADNAVAALEIICHEPIALLLLDVSMPEIDGLELCRTIRNLPQFPDLPIVMLTARDGAFDKVRGRMAGATEYLTKPFDEHQLRKVVQRLVKVGPTVESSEHSLKRTS